MADLHYTTVPAAEGPYHFAAAVTPADGADLADFASALFVGGAGALKVDTVGGSTVTFTGVAAGSVLRIRVKRVYATGTTATNIAALW
jgi:hypothetical protein